MSVVFLNIVLWPFLILAAVPLLLHLFARTRPPVYRFSAVDFILRIIRLTHRVKKPQDWLLLLIRTLIVLAIVLLFLQPLFFSHRRLSQPFERKNVVVVVDATASMGYHEGGQTRFASACAHASGILSGLTVRDSANVVWLKARPAAVFPSLGVNFRYLQSELRRARATLEAGDAGAALRLAMDQLAKAEGKREIFVISDFQRSGWEKTDIVPPPGVHLVKVKIGKEIGGNGALGDIAFDPPKALAGEEVAIVCDVHNFSAQPRRRTVYLAIQERRESQDLSIAPWEKASAVFRHRFGAAGTFPVFVSLDEDPFPGDDRRWALVDVRESLRVGIVASDGETAAAWRRALDALGWARIENLAAGDTAGLQPFDVVLLAGDDGSGPERLAGRVLDGATVVWSPASAGAKVAAPGASNEPPVDLRWKPAEGPIRLKVVAPKADVFRLFAEGEHGDPAKGLFSGRFVASGLLKGYETLLAYDDGGPALARLKRNGSVFFWNVTLRREFSDYAARVEYLPLLAELLLLSRTRGAAEAAGRDFLPGDRLAWRLEGEVTAADVRLVGPGGTAIEVREQRTARDASLVTPEIGVPGLYAWEEQGRPMGYSTVNFPPAESDLRALAMSELETFGSVGVREGVALHWLREGIPLWPYLLALAVFLALVEGLTLLWAERS